MQRLESTLLTIGVLLGAAICLFYSFIPLPLEGQAIAGIITVTLLLLVSRWKTPQARFILAALAVVTSTRYMFWRYSSTMNFGTTLEAVLGIGMFLAEIFLWFILISNFVQNLWPARRKPIPLPNDTTLWPTVDVYIATYNEPLEIVSPTILAAKAIDYPADKLNVYVLDDGRRTEFRDYAAKNGVGYISREDNRFAKAGNLNNALTETDGEFIAAFDCDHVPTRSFLQKTLGWVLEDQKMALVQTPHHFYNQDPIERNLTAGADIPNEGLLFYGLTQDGNDFWNAAYFCGSCAILRREALLDIGGFAVETVTEDAHTSLRLHRAGWNSSYLREPLAAGLATESVADHVGQRARWARGMIQILRLENPLFGKGLSIAQRLCYLNSMLHFLFPLPRIVLLTAPLAYLLFNIHIINASALQLLAYAGPHLAVALVSSVIVMGRYRYVFWAEIYETLLSFHLALPTLTTMLSPFKGRFNVTSKGIERKGEHFEWRMQRSLLTVTALIVGGIVFGAVRLALGGITGDEVGTMLINLVWAGVSLMFIGVALAVGREAAEYRENPRVDLDMPVNIVAENGHSWSANSTNLSLGGLHIDLPRPESFEQQALYIEIPCGTTRTTLKAHPQHWDENGLRARWYQTDDIDQAADLVRTLLGREQAWSNWDAARTGSFRSSLLAIVRSLFGFFRYVGRSVFRKSAVS